MEVLKYRKDINSPWQEIVAIKGDKGEDGKDYVLTAADKVEIVEMVIAQLPVYDGGVL